MDMVAWIRSIVASLTARGRFARIELWHGGADGQPTRLDTFEELRDEEKDTVVDAERLARHFQALAQADADTHSATGGVATQRYLLTGHYGDEEAAASTFPFAVRGVESARSVAESFQGSEPPTEKGAIAMLMRQNDNLTRLVTQMFESGPGIMMAQNRELARQLAEEKQNNLDRYVLAEATRDRQQDRLLVAAREEQEMQRKADLWGLLKSYAPAVVQGLPGAKRTNVIGQSVMDFVAGMTTEEVQRIASSLEPARRTQFAMILQTVQAEAEKRATETPDGVRVETVDPQKGHAA